MYKLFVMCPKENTEDVINAMANAGAGVIGNYSHCAFVTEGKGNWFSEEGSIPTIGKVGSMTSIIENKIEMVCPETKLENVVKAIKSVHPYETPAIDVIKLEELVI